MLKISSILKFIRDNMTHDTDRFVVMNDEHVIDTKTGVELHLYDDYFKMTRNGEKIAKMGDFTHEEQDVVMEIKKLITDPLKAKQREEEYPSMLKRRREKLSHLYEHPTPMTIKSPIVEDDTEDYKG